MAGFDRSRVSEGKDCTAGVVIQGKSTRAEGIILKQCYAPSMGKGWHMKGEEWNQGDILWFLMI